MPPNAKRRHKNALEPISIDELYESSTMKGLLTFMEPLPSPARTEVSPDTSSTLSPDRSARSLLVSSRSREVSPDTSTQSSPDTTRKMSPDVSIETSPDTSSPGLAQYRGRLFQLKKGSDALIPEEQLLYQYMWNNGSPVAHTAMVRTFTGSMSLLTKEIKRGDDRSTKRVVDTLIRKLAISIARRESHNHLIPRTYYVFHWTEMQARHKRQGWTWAIKNRGIQLLTQDQAHQIQQLQKRTGKEKPELAAAALGPLAPLDIFSQPSGDTSHQPSGDSSLQLSPDSPDSYPEVSGDSWSAYPNKTSTERQRTEQTTTANDIAAIVAVLQQTLGHADDDAARRILTTCRQQAPEAPLEHILHFTGLTAQRMRSIRTVANPMGLVIRHTPKHFCGESYTQFALEDARRRDEEHDRQQRIQDELMADARQILADPQATAEDVAFAQDILAEGGQQRGAAR